MKTLLCCVLLFSSSLVFANSSEWKFLTIDAEWNIHKGTAAVILKNGDEFEYPKQYSFSIQFVAKDRSNQSQNFNIHGVMKDNSIAYLFLHSNLEGKVAMGPSGVMQECSGKYSKISHEDSDEVQENISLLCDNSLFFTFRRDSKRK
ncbi:MAG: hypothetical protein M0011_01480 [Elusimicrobia bacterium]|nr:hypothetical protein [Elusimicrobiota bacterium]